MNDEKMMRPRYIACRQLECVELKTLLDKLQEHVELSTGNGLTDFNFDEDTSRIEIVVERYADCGQGSEGYEMYTGEIPVRVIDGHWVVFPSELELTENIPAHPPYEYSVSEAREWLDECYKYEDAKWQDELDENPSDDEMLELAQENGMGAEDYYPPDDDFAFSELEHALEQCVSELRNSDVEMSGCASYADTACAPI